MDEQPILEHHARDVLRFIVDRVDLGVFMLDHNLKITLWNKFMASHSGCSEADLIGQDIFECFPELPEKWFRKKIQSVLMLGSYAFTSWEQRPYLFKFQHNRPATGGLEQMFQNITLIPVKDQEGQVDELVITLRDVTDEGMYRKKLSKTMKELEHASQVDGLTEIYNRAYWESLLKNEFDRFKRYGNKFSLVMFDIDHFKKINDTYGHVVGDQVIRIVSNMASNSIREVDVLGRYGGEEFGIILPETGLIQAKIVAERIRLCCFNNSLEIKDKGQLKVSVTCSFGVAEVCQSMQTYDGFIELADAALYKSKDRGRNTTTCVDLSDSCNQPNSSSSQG